MVIQVWNPGFLHNNKIFSQTTSEQPGMDDHTNSPGHIEPGVNTTSITPSKLPKHVCVKWIFCFFIASCHLDCWLEHVESMSIGDDFWSPICGKLIFPGFWTKWRCCWQHIHEESFLLDLWTNNRSAQLRTTNGMKRIKLCYNNK